MVKVCIISGCYYSSQKNIKNEKKKKQPSASSNKVSILTIHENELLTCKIPIPEGKKPPYYICELHFHPDDIVKVDKITLKDGSVSELPRINAFRKPNALPINIQPIQKENSANPTRQDNHSPTKQALAHCSMQNETVVVDGEYDFGKSPSPKRLRLSQASDSLPCDMLETEIIVTQQIELNDSMISNTHGISSHEDTTDLSFSVDGNDSSLNGSAFNNQSCGDINMRPDISVAFSPNNSLPSNVTMTTTDFNSQLTFNNLKQLLQSSIILPQCWCYSIHSDSIVFFYIYKLNNSLKLTLTVDESMNVYINPCGVNKPQLICQQLSSHEDLLQHLVAVEKLDVCTGVGFTDEKYAPQCSGFLLESDKYIRHQPKPRCLACRNVRKRILTTQSKHRQSAGDKARMRKFRNVTMQLRRARVRRLATA